MKICLDAGHGAGYNPSPADPSYREGTRMFDLQKYLKAALERYGIEVVCTRRTVDDCPSLYERGMMSRGCELLLSLHTNAVGSERNDMVDYVRVYYPVSRRGQALAQALSEVIAAVMGTSQQPQFVVRKNGAGNADYYGVIRYAAAVGTCGMILEHSFHTHPRTTAWLLSDENLQRLAEAEAALIAEYYGLEEPEMRYELLKDVKSEFYRPTLEKLLKLDILRGKGGEGEDTILDLGEDAVRLLVLLDRAGLFPAAEEQAAAGSLTTKG